MIFKMMSVSIETINTIALITDFFPDEVIETIRKTNVLIYLANSYCLVSPSHF